MKKLLLAGFLAAGLAGGAAADDGRFQVVQGTMSGGEVKTGQTAVVLKVDAETGDTWRLIVSAGTYWWIPIKNGVIPQKKAETEPAAEPAVPAQ